MQSAELTVQLVEDVVATAGLQRQDFMVVS
jgi:hypothetical protein